MKKVALIAGIALGVGAVATAAALYVRHVRKNLATLQSMNEDYKPKKGEVVDACEEKSASEPEVEVVVTGSDAAEDAAE